MKPVLPIVVLIALLGCAPMPEPPFVLPPPDNSLDRAEPDICGVGEFGGLIGQNESVLRTVKLTRPYRVIPLGGMVTQDYSAQRLNFYLDENRAIMQITCG
jgi:hypothetical protein